MAKQRISRRERREIRRRAAQRRRLAIPIIVLGGALLIAAGGWLWWNGRLQTQAAFDYNPQDISYDQPLHAVHEMNAGPPIPFLPKSEPQPRIAVNEDFHSFGVVGPTDIATHDFVIANIGDAPLTISRAYTTCGCTTADLTSALIPPGKVSIVTVTFDAGFHDTRGQTVRRGIILENNDPKNSNVELWLQASVSQ